MGSKAWKLVAWETVGTEAYDDDEQTLIGYDNIRTGHTLLTGEALERFEEDGEPFEPEGFRSVKVVAEGDDVDAFVAAVNKAVSVPA